MDERIERIKSELKEILSEYRYNHSISVMNKCIELAKIHGTDVEEATLAGLLHDNSKEMSLEENIKYANENGIEFDEIEMKNPSLMHGKVGADIAIKKYGVSEKVAHAIKVHTTTELNMNELDKIVFIADKIEVSRDSAIDNIELERELSHKDLDVTMLYILNGTIKFLLENDKLIHPNAIYTRNQLLEKLNNK